MCRSIDELGSHPSPRFRRAKAGQINQLAVGDTRLAVQQNSGRRTPSKHVPYRATPKIGAASVSTSVARVHIGRGRPDDQSLHGSCPVIDVRCCRRCGNGGMSSKIQPLGTKALIKHLRRNSAGRYAGGSWRRAAGFHSSMPRPLVVIVRCDRSGWRLRPQAGDHPGSRDGV